MRANNHPNHQGSILFTTRSNAVADKYHYGPYGEPLSTDPVTGNAIRYTGRYFDAESGLYYYRARYFSTRLGRFLQTDPIGVKDDLNTYTYAGNDPFDRSDPTGECPLCAVVGAVVGYSVSVGFQTFRAVTKDHKPLLSALATAATSKESAGAAVGGAIVGGTLGAGSAIVGTTTLAGTAAGTAAEVGLAAGTAVPATLASAAVQGGPLPSAADIGANAAGNMLGLGGGKLIEAAAETGVRNTAGAFIFSNEKVANTAVSVAAGTGAAAKEVGSEMISQSVESKAKQALGAGKSTCNNSSSGCSR